MIYITIYHESKTNRICGFQTSGHAGYAESGMDIICSAVSALTITAINSIDELTDSRYGLEENAEQGMIDYRLDAPVSAEADLILRSMVVGLRGIEQQYGKKYLKVNTKEV